MTDYVKITDYAAKDSLLTGNPAKLVKGSEIGADFDAVVVAIASKPNSADPIFTGTTTIATADINGGTIDGTAIGGTTPAAISATTITASGEFTLTGAGTGITFEGTTADAHEVKLVGGEPTSDITITLPSATDTIVGKATTDTLTNKTLTAATNTVEATSGPSGSAFGFRNKIINGGFTINQRAYVSGAALASGSYGHDRFKAGASGGNYTFTQLASNTTITIEAGKSLIQVVEDKNIDSTSYVLSWTGTAQARYGINSATPSGTYASSPILITGQTAGTVMSVEFNEGTIGKVQLEAGSVSTPFEQRPYGAELALCQRYYQEGIMRFRATLLSGTIEVVNQLPVTMRAAPTVTGTGISALGSGTLMLSDSATGSTGNVSYTATSEL